MNEEIMREGNRRWVAGDFCHGWYSRPGLNGYRLVSGGNTNRD
jgi:hypothetical protein